MFIEHFYIIWAHVTTSRFMVHISETSYGCQFINIKGIINY